MKNRIPAYLATPRRKGPSSQPAFHELRDLAQKQMAYRLGQVEAYVQEHPVTGIAAAFCIGVFLGWIVKRR